MSCNYIIPHPAAFEASAVPTVVQVAAVFNNKKGVGCGGCLLVSDLSKRFPKSLADMCFPLALESVARLHPLLQWRGNMIQEIFKGKGYPGIPRSVGMFC